MIGSWPLTDSAWRLFGGRFIGCTKTQKTKGFTHYSGGSPELLRDLSGSGFIASYIHEANQVHGRLGGCGVCVGGGGRIVPYDC